MNTEQINLEFNPLPDPGELFKNPASQNYRLYKRLLTGPVTNEEIADRQGLHLRSYGRRICDVREALHPYNWGIKAHRLNGGLFEYRLSILN